MKIIIAMLLLLGACMTESQSADSTVGEIGAQSFADLSLSLTEVKPKSLCTTLAGDCWTAGLHIPAEADEYCIDECNRPARCNVHQTGTGCDPPPGQQNAVAPDTCRWVGSCVLLSGPV